MPTVKEIFDEMPSHFRPDQAMGTNAVVQYDISGEGGGTWHAIISDGTCTVKEGAAPTPNLRVQVGVQDWLDVTTGRKNPRLLFMAGKLKFKGDMGLAIKLGSLFTT